MIYKAEPSLSKLLLAMPESGMGYQVIEARRQERLARQIYMVYNSELIFDLDDTFPEFRRILLDYGPDNALYRAEPITLFQPTLVPKSLLNGIHQLSDEKRAITGRFLGHSGARRAHSENTCGKEKFSRLSAFRDDRRIDAVHGRLLPGSYATTFIDFLTCKVFMDNPADRYVMPAEELVTWVFHLVPSVIDKVQRGVVMPALDYDGGGVEVYFDSGTTASTLKSTETLSR
ncbi:MAG TPA: hypothetical protein PKG48_05895 [Bacteroidales bacterium]|nr:hypothetical protein [Bacteroidales bacterium]HPS63047.1 hypothetical protein [Bacteroidales bacterium]